MSDHKCLSLCMIVNKNEIGPGYWKFNVSLLKNESFISEMKDFILHFQDTDDSQTSWENLKQAIKSFSKRLSRSVKEKIKRIEKEIIEIENKDSFLMDINRKRDLENELSEQIDKKTSGAQIRS